MKEERKREKKRNLMSISKVLTLLFLNTGAGMGQVPTRPAQGKEAWIH